MKIKELLKLQTISVLLFIGLSIILYITDAFNIVTSCLVYIMLAVGNVINANNFLLKPIEEASVYDKLTGCYNRVKLENKKEEYDNYNTYAVIFFDVNNLKKANDIHGHDEGDRVLTEAANQLKFWRRYGDLYRIGGDEFIVVIPNAKKDPLEIKLKQWYVLQPVLNTSYKDDFDCNFSYGMFYKGYNETTSFEEIMQKADEEMYRMKKELKTQRGNA